MSGPEDAVIVGAGAAGLATAIFARRLNPAARIVLVDGARAPGAKILVSGGSRCNVTNTVVTESDFNGGRPAIIRRVLRRLPVPDTIEFFQELGLPLHEEPLGKLFPDSHRSRDVLDALLAEAARRGVSPRPAHRVSEIGREGGHFRITTAAGPLHARAVVLATGGLSLPKTGSDGWGYQAAVGLGHSIVPTTPALAPLVLDPNGEGAIHAGVSGVALPVRIDVRVDGRVTTRVTGSLLWTHFGVSGPAALDASRHWLRARLERRAVSLSVSFCPDDWFESLDAAFLALAGSRPRLTLQGAVADRVPASIASAVLAHLRLDATGTLAAMTRDTRHRLTRALLEWPLPVGDSRGYNYAEVTAGGIPLTEVDSATMESRRCTGLFLVGEILDVDGRIGGFNFQWAWCTGRIAGEALAERAVRGLRVLDEGAGR